MQRTFPWLAGALALLTGCADSPVAPAAPPEPLMAVSRVDVCHVDDDGMVRRITIADAALPAHIDHGDVSPGTVFAIPAGSTFSASAEWQDGPTLWSADKAFDGDPVSRWNAGGGPVQWIEVDFGATMSLAGMEAVAHVFPEGATNNDVSLDGTYAFSWTGFTFNGEVLSEPFATVRKVQRVRVTTTSSSSWVAWYEIRFTAPDC